MRNYLQEALGVGQSVSQIARELGKSRATVRSWASGATKTTVSYEAQRNVYRRASYTAMRKAGWASRQATAIRRAKPLQVVERVQHIKRVHSVFHDEWNASYYKYKANPKAWLKAHPNKTPPKFISEAEIKRRINKGLTKHDVEFIEGEY